MTQRIFDVENEKDYADLWDILPDDVVRLKKNEPNTAYCVYEYSDLSCFINKMLKINWHDKTEITRPIQEATEQDLGKLCKFWDYEEVFSFGILNKIEVDFGKEEKLYRYRGGAFSHCRRLTKQEIEELC